MNGGTCVSVVGLSYCDCTVGFEGEYCEQPITTTNACASMPCLYGGSCIIGLDSFISCMCQSGFTGSMCEEAINECTSNPCLNGGTCIDGQALFICLCSNEYNGTRCEELGQSNPPTTTKSPTVATEMPSSRSTTRINGPSPPEISGITLGQIAAISSGLAVLILFTAVVWIAVCIRLQKESGKKPERPLSMISQPHSFKDPPTLDLEMQEINQSRGNEIHVLS
eukprot:XP_011670227.1 PREDICTED: delta-like protein 1 [Strongylocentrotus purpuratus]